MEGKNDTMRWHGVSFNLHKLTHILKAAACVSEDDEPINETINTLVHLALAHVEEIQEEVHTLRMEYYAQVKDTAQNTRTDAAG